MWTDEFEDKLGRDLYEKMEHLDPSIEEIAWLDMSDREKEFYITAITTVIETNATALAKRLKEIERVTTGGSNG